MGSSESKEEIKAVDTNGNVNNNVVIHEPVPIHNAEMMVLLYILCIVKIIQFIFFVYTYHVKRLKKRYTKSVRDINLV